MAMRPIAVSCGDPAGIGPEIAQLAWDRLRGSVPFFWIGDPRHLPLDLPAQVISTPDEATEVAASALPILPLPFASEAVPGHPDLSNADGIIASIEKGVELVHAGHAGAICTAPINKKVLQDGAGFAFPGHTEFLAHLGGVDDVVMMLASDLLRVVPATIHIPLAEVPSALTAASLKATLRITHNALQSTFGIAEPRIAVAGLNPHAGEGGKMGREEIDLIAPVLEELRSEGLRLQGPLSADTMFHAAARARYDAAVCMYHDQALIPIKALAFDDGVNITLGLPFLRTSPDHGTAYDIAGQGLANPTSMVAALQMAWDLANGRR